MKKTYYIVIALALMLGMSCKSPKSLATQAEIESLSNILNKKHFRIESDWAYPQVTAAVQQVMSSGLLPPGSSSNAISLIGNSNFIEINGDSISSYLPYYGERKMQVGYGSNDSAIQFDGLIKDYTMVKNKKNGYNISFSALSNAEQFNVNISIFPNLKANIGLNSGSILGIRYSGKVIRP